MGRQLVIPRGAMPHPWWMFWQIGDFLIMVTIVGLFLRYVLRSSRSQEAGDPPIADAPATDAPATDPATAEPAAGARAGRGADASGEGAAGPGASSSRSEPAD